MVNFVEANIPAVIVVSIPTPTAPLSSPTLSTSKGLSESDKINLGVGIGIGVGIGLFSFLTALATLFKGKTASARDIRSTRSLNMGLWP